MKIDVLKLPYTKSFEIAEEVHFDPEKFICHTPLVEVLKCNTSIKIQRFEEFIYVTINIIADVVLECSYTLEHFKSKIRGTDELHFSSINEDDDDTIVYKGNSIELDEYIFNLLSASVPLSPKSPNVKIPNSGDGYRIISDNDLYKEKEEQGNSKFDALKDLDFE